MAQLNEMLQDQHWWSIDRRKDAEVRFEPVVVAAFFDGMEAGKVSSIELREGRIALPTAADGYSRAMLVGPTGTGKTTLLRHAIGADHKRDRFPSTSTARTTTCDVEIVTAEGLFEAVVTFMPDHEVRAHIDECLEEASLRAVQGQPEEKIAAALLSHREQRFRLSYTLGGWGSNEPDGDAVFTFDDDEGDSDEIDPAEAVSASEEADNRVRLDSFLARIHALVQEVGAQVAERLGRLDAQGSPDDNAAWLEEFTDTLYEHDEFAKLALDIMDAVEDRFRHFDLGNFEFTATGWPLLWTFTSEARDSFLRVVRWFSSNHRRQFGRLLTPLVDGMRVRGPFYPANEELRVAPKIVVLDGEGLGHSLKAASSISTRITRRFEEVDLILLVDTAQQPIQAVTLEFLRTVGASGYVDKLAVAFTHFDLVKGPNLSNQRLKREHVMNSVRDAIGTLRDSIGIPVATALQNRIESTTYFLGGMDRELSKIPSGFQEQLRGLLETIQAAAIPPPPVAIAPIYEVEGLEIALRDAVEGFQAPWQARLGLRYHDGIAKEHWTRIKALARRFANAWSNEYDDLRPVADLVARLQENISKWLDSPARWTREPEGDDDKMLALSAIRKAVFAALHDLAEYRLSNAPRSGWETAYKYSGRGSTSERAGQIDHIYHDAAPFISSAMSREARAFLHALYDIVQKAVENAGGVMSSPARLRTD